jgi:hypothetical protein
MYEDTLLDSRRWRYRVCERRIAAGLPMPGNISKPAGVESSSPDAPQEDEWWPSEEDVEASPDDPDMPLSGECSINIALELRLLEILVPTLVVKPEATASKAAANDDDEESVSVRYFVRLSAYTDFVAEARVWNAMEIVLFRDEMYGNHVPGAQSPATLLEGSGCLTLSTATLMASDSVARSPMNAVTVKPPPAEIPIGEFCIGLVYAS